MGWFKRLFGTTENKDTFFTDEGGTPAVLSVAVIAKIHDKWPNLIWGTHIWLADSKYFLPTKRALQSLLNSSPVAYYEYVPEIEDCDDFALLLHAFVVRKRYDAYKAGKLPPAQQSQLAFGQAWYEDSVLGNHAVNVCVTSDAGIVFIEPQSNKFVNLGRVNKVLFIRI